MMYVYLLVVMMVVVVVSVIYQTETLKERNTHISCKQQLSPLNTTGDIIPHGFHIRVNNLDTKLCKYVNLLSTVQKVPMPSIKVYKLYKLRDTCY